MAANAVCASRLFCSSAARFSRSTAPKNLPTSYLWCAVTAKRRKHGEGFSCCRLERAGVMTTDTEGIYPRALTRRRDGAPHMTWADGVIRSEGWCESAKPARIAPSGGRWLFTLNNLQKRGEACFSFRRLFFARAVPTSKDEMGEG